VLISTRREKAKKAAETRIGGISRYLKVVTQTVPTGKEAVRGTWVKYHDASLYSSNFGLLMVSSILA